MVLETSMDTLTGNPWGLPLDCAFQLRALGLEKALAWPLDLASAKQIEGAARQLVQREKTLLQSWKYSPKLSGFELEREWALSLAGVSLATE